MLRPFLVLCAVVGAAAHASPYDRSLPLYNAAEPGLTIPHVGLGTGGYTKGNLSDHVQATKNWLLSGGRRLDCSLTYNDQLQVAQGIRESGVDRDEIFITSKVGPTDPLGYNDTLDQMQSVLETLNTTYVDLLLIHWPGAVKTTPSSDPACTGPNSSPKLCRQSTWRALEALYAKGQARAIGVSNFEKHHIEDILELGSLVPSVNQFEFHPFWHEFDLVAYCRGLNITVNGYSPLGAPDVSRQRGWDLTADPMLTKLGEKYGKSAAQVILQWEWQQRVIVNPRTNNTAHMIENLQFAGTTTDAFSLTNDEMEAIASLKHANPKICPDPHTIP